MDFTTSDISKILDLSYKQGLKVNINLLSGHPSETEQEFQESVEFLRENKYLIDEIELDYCLSSYFKEHFFPEKIYLCKYWDRCCKCTHNNNEKIAEIAEKFKDAKNFLYLGRGINFPVALEGALKLKEISYIHAEGYPAAEMKHGPIALIDEDMPVVFIATKDLIYDKVISNLEEVRARKGKIIAIANYGDKKIAELADHVIFIPEACQPMIPILAVIPLQLLAYYIAIKRGCDVDQPRNLAKSVTVE